jgi:GNAT superfamily N-acetyltransferase
MQSVEIKAIDHNDFDIWLPLWEGYQRFYEVDIPEPVTLKTWVRFLDPVEPMYAALAIVGEQALGLVHSIYHRSAWTTGDHCYLQDLFVADDARGSGMGRALIEHVYVDARRRGASRVYWLSNHYLHNNPAEGITIKFGDRVKERSSGYTDEEAISILRAALSYKQANRELEKTAAAKRWVPWLCAFTGARVGEPLRLRRSDVRKVGSLQVGFRRGSLPDPRAYRSGGGRGSESHRRARLYGRPRHPVPVVNQIRTYL